MDADLRRLKREGMPLVREAEQIVRKWKNRMPRGSTDPLETGMDSFRKALNDQNPYAAQEALERIEHQLDAYFSFARKSALRDWLESLLVALLIALVLRTFVLEAFKIPSGSMIPTLVVGDHIFVNKFVYGVRLPLLNKRLVGWNTPERGEVIVFVYPEDPDKDYIKRVIGVPGDRITIDGEQVSLNDEPIPMEPGVPFYYTDEAFGTPRNCLARRTRLGEADFIALYDPSRYHPRQEMKQEYVVEPGHLFVMGDNRDNSSDSRAWGQVPLDNVKGRAMIVWWSSSSKEGVRFDRIFHVIR